MTGWQLDPAGVDGVLAGVRVERADLWEVLVGPEGAPVDRAGQVVEGLGVGVGTLAPVGEAVVALMRVQQGNVQGVVDRIDAGLLGVGAAASAYEDGALGMAGQFQAAAARAGATGDFSWFEQRMGG